VIRKELNFLGPLFTNSAETTGSELAPGMSIPAEGQGSAPVVSE